MWRATNARVGRRLGSRSLQLLRRGLKWKPGSETKAKLKYFFNDVKSRHTTVIGHRATTGADKMGALTLC
jgi:hypothetical protein